VRLPRWSPNGEIGCRISALHRRLELPVVSALLEIVCVAAPLVGVSLVVRTSRFPALAPFLPGIVATGLGVSLFEVTYLWIFQKGATCSGLGDVGCRLNSNQGVLTTLTLALAAAAIWTTVITREMDRRRAKSAMAERAYTAVYAAVDECHHNLIHVAIAFDSESRLRRRPQLSMSCLTSLNLPDLRMYISPVVMDTLAAICRNHEQWVEMPWSDDDETSLPEVFTAFVSRSLVFLMLCMRDHPSWVPPDLAEPGMRGLREAIDIDTVLFSYASSDTSEQDVASLRREGGALVVWWDDAPIHNLKTFALGEPFRDIAASHKH
jgi:hypothetical protein